MTFYRLSSLLAGSLDQVPAAVSYPAVLTAGFLSLNRPGEPLPLAQAAAPHEGMAVPQALAEPEGVAAPEALQAASMPDRVSFEELPQTVIQQLRSDGTRGEWRDLEGAREVFEHSLPDSAKVSIEAVEAITNDPDIHWMHIVPHADGGGTEASNGVYGPAELNHAIGSRTMTADEVELAMDYTDQVARSVDGSSHTIDGWDGYDTGAYLERPDSSSWHQVSWDQTSWSEPSWDHTPLDQSALAQTALDQTALDQTALDQTALDPWVVASSEGEPSAWDHGSRLSVDAEAAQLDLPAQEPQPTIALQMLPLSAAMAGGLAMAHRWAQLEGFRSAGRPDLAQAAEQQLLLDGAKGAVNGLVRGSSVLLTQAVLGAHPLSAGLGLVAPDAVRLWARQGELSEADRQRHTLALVGKGALATALVCTGPLGWLGLTGLSLAMAYSGAASQGQRRLVAES